MDYDILSVHIEMDVNKQHQVTVAIMRNEQGGWKAYKSNPKLLAGYPKHDTSNINEELFQRVAASGIALDKAAAQKMFRELSKQRCENE